MPDTAHRHRDEIFPHSANISTFGRVNPNDKYNGLDIKNGQRFYFLYGRVIEGKNLCPSGFMEATITLYNHQVFKKFRKF